jgi:hypothetical protein
MPNASAPSSNAARTLANAILGEAVPWRAGAALREAITS